MPPNLINHQVLLSFSCVLYHGLWTPECTMTHEGYLQVQLWQTGRVHMYTVAKCMSDFILIIMLMVQAFVWMFLRPWHILGYTCKSKPKKYFTCTEYFPFPDKNYQGYLETPKRFFFLYLDANVSYITANIFHLSLIKQKYDKWFMKKQQKNNSMFHTEVSRNW